MIRKGQSKPLVEKFGNVSIPIYERTNRGYAEFTVAWKEGGKRLRKVFSSLAKAKALARDTASRIENQERHVSSLSAEDSRAYVNAITSLRPHGIRACLKT